MVLKNLIPLRFRRLLRDDAGIALIAAIGMLGVLSLMGAGAVAYSSSNARSASISVKQANSGHVAEAGISDAISLLANASDPGSPSALPPGGTSFDGESVTWSGVLAGDVWTITSTALVRNPTGAAPLRRTAKTKVRVAIDPSTNGNEAWNYVYADDTSTCTTLPNSVIVATPLFVKGDLCIENSAGVLGSPLVKVGGKIRINSPQGFVGQPGTYGNPPVPATIGELHVGGGCTYRGGPVASPCTSAQRVYATTADADVGTIQKPPIDLARWYQESRPGPMGNCTIGSFPGGFDRDTTLGGLRLAQPVNLMPAAPYNCIFMEGPHTLGQISWSGGTNGTLTILGTIFFDGDIIMNSNTTGVYQGRGTIYASGRIEMGNGTRLCGAANCNRDAWDPNENLLVFVAGSSTASAGFLIQNSAALQGAVYAVTDYVEQNSVDMQGPVIARQLYYRNSAEAVKWVPIWAMVVGVPSNGTSRTVTQVNESWGE